MTHDAAEFDDALRQALAGVVRLAEWGTGAGIPEALGLSPEEWAQRLLNGRGRLSIQERRTVVAANPDMSTRQLAGALGVHHSTIAEDRAPVGNPTPQEPRPAPAPTAPVGNPTPRPEYRQPQGDTPEARRRDARRLLMQAVDMLRPAPGFVSGWVKELGEVEPELVQRIDDAIGTLTDLRRKVATP